MLVDGAGFEEASDAPRLGQIAAVLDHRVDTAGIANGGDDGARILGVRRQRFLGQDVTAVAQGGEHDLAARRRHDDVKDDVRLRLGKHRVEVVTDHRIGEPELVGSLPRPGAIDVDESDDLRVGSACGREPGLTHRAATDENRAYHHLHPTQAVVERRAARPMSIDMAAGSLRTEPGHLIALPPAYCAEQCAG
jgi:hypothetical protein